MTRDYAAFLRGISNVPMRPFRTALEDLGLLAVASFGASGNLTFRAGEVEPRSLEALIEEAVGVPAFVRSRQELEAIVRNDPHAALEGAAVFLAKQPVDPTRAASLLEGGFEGVPPVIDGSTVYFVHPTRHPGRKAIVDFERELDVSGTMRSSRVLARVLESM